MYYIFKNTLYNFYYSIFLLYVMKSRFPIEKNRNFIINFFVNVFSGIHNYIPENNRKLTLAFQFTNVGK
jgi:hypothetical protein